MSIALAVDSPRGLICCDELIIIALAGDCVTVAVSCCVESELSLTTISLMLCSIERFSGSVNDKNPIGSK
jgi:hypothetical protein